MICCTTAQILGEFRVPEPYILFFGRLFSNYTIAIGVSVLFAGIWVADNLRDTLPLRRILDLYILLLIHALIFGRLIYVLTHFDYYGIQPEEIFYLQQGGIDWHGAVWSGCLMIWLFARWQHITFLSVLNAFAPALPVLMFGAWWGCHAASCAYGAEIQNISNYPSWLVWEGPDIYGLRLPRFYTQSIGTLFAFGLLLITWLLTRLKFLRWNRFGLVLALMSLVMFGIGFMRGDDVLYVFNLRSDQWLDLIMLVFALVLLQRSSGTVPKKGYDFVKQPLILKSD
jgi:phosphatidylglycerol---prolipoprotein diacylglyceryl transferase